MEKLLKQINQVFLKRVWLKNQKGGFASQPGVAEWRHQNPQQVHANAVKAGQPGVKNPAKGEGVRPYAKAHPEELKKQTIAAGQSSNANKKLKSDEEYLFIYWNKLTDERAYVFITGFNLLSPVADELNLNNTRGVPDIRWNKTTGMTKGKNIGKLISRPDLRVYNWNAIKLTSTEQKQHYIIILKKLDLLFYSILYQNILLKAFPLKNLIKRNKNIVFF